METIAARNRIWLFWFILALACVICSKVFGGDIVAGKIFTDGERNITHTMLNLVVGGAVIQPSFYSGKTAVTTVDLDDVFLMLDPTTSTYEKVEARYLFADNPTLISSQTTFGTEVPLGGDYLLAYDTSLAANRKLLLSWLGANWTNWIAAPSVLAEPVDVTSSEVWMPVWHSSTNGWYKANPGTIAWRVWQKGITNAASKATPLATDIVPMWDTAAGTNRAQTTVQLLYGGTSSSTMDDTNKVPMYSENAHASVSLGTIKTHVLASVPRQVTNSVSSLITLGAGNQTYTWTHNLTSNSVAVPPQFVRCVLVCQSVEWTYEVGDELDTTGCFINGGSRPAFIVSSSSTAVTVHQPKDIDIYDETSDDVRSLTASRWKLKIYAAVFP